MNMYKGMITAGIIVLLIGGLYLYVDGLKSKLISLKNELKDAQIELANRKLESQRYKTSLDKQNEDIEFLKASKKLALAKLAKWHKQKEKIRYKIIREIREVKSDDCEDIKNTLDAVRDIDYNSL